MNGNSYHTINIQVQVQSFCVTKLSKYLISNDSLVLVVCFTYYFSKQIEWILIVILVLVLQYFLPRVLTVSIGIGIDNTF